MTSKTCRDCKQDKPLTDFYWHRFQRKYSSYCKPCHIVRAKKRIAEKPDEHYKATQRYRARHPEQMRQWQRERKRRLRADPAKRAAEMAQARERKRERYHTDPEYRARKLAQGAVYREQQRQQQQKVCPDCQQQKPYSEFYCRDNGKPYAYCQECHKQRNTEWYRTHSERAADIRRKWKQQNPDRVREHARRGAQKYRDKNRERVRAYSREYMRQRRQKQREERPDP